MGEVVNLQTRDADRMLKSLIGQCETAVVIYVGTDGMTRMATHHSEVSLIAYLLMYGQHALFNPYNDGGDDDGAS